MAEKCWNEGGKREREREINNNSTVPKPTN